MKRAITVGHDIRGVYTDSILVVESVGILDLSTACATQIDSIVTVVVTVAIPNCSFFRAIDEDPRIAVVIAVAV